MVLFTRVERRDEGSRASGNAGRTHDDLYRVVLENAASARIDDVALVAALKRELVAFVHFTTASSVSLSLSLSRRVLRLSLSLSLSDVGLFF